MSGRREQREEIQRTWVVYEPAGKPGPFTQQGMVDADFAAGEPLPMPKTYRVERIDGSKLTRATK